jgi:hypothetical protein
MFMSAAANLPDPPTQPSRSANLLCLVRKLIDYGRELAATIRQRAFTDPGPVIFCFGTADVAQILARISRGLHRANALEARLLRNADRLDAAPRGAASPGKPPRPPRTKPTPASHTCRPRSRLPQKSAASRSARSSPTSAAISASCRAIRCGGN